MAARKPPSPFRRFNSSPEVIRTVVMMYARCPFPLRNVEDLLAQRGIDVSYGTVRFWWNRFGPMFAAEIRRKRVESMRAYTHWRWHLDEVYVRINGVQHSLWRAVGHEGEVLESFVTKERAKAAALKVLRNALKRHGAVEGDHHRPPALLWSGHEGARERREARGGPLGQQPSREQPPAVPTKGADDERVPPHAGCRL